MHSRKTLAERAHESTLNNFIFLFNSKLSRKSGNYVCVVSCALRHTNIRFLAPFYSFLSLYVFEICSYTTSSGFSISLMVLGDAVIEVHIDWISLRLLFYAFLYEEPILFTLSFMWHICSFYFRIVWDSS